MPPRVRPLRSADAAAARALLEAERPRHPYAARAIEILEAAAASAGEPDAEYRALVAAEGDTVVGVASFGLVAGTEDAGALYSLTVAAGSRRRGVGRALVRAAAVALAALGASFVVAELADDPELGALAALLDAAGFSEEGRVADLVRDGVALRVLRLPLPLADEG